MNGTYDFSSLNHNGYSTNTLGYSESTAEVDVFERVTAPLISQLTVGYSQAQTYMQELITLRERYKALETQHLRVTTERDTLRTMFDQLSATLHKQDASRSSTPSIPMKTAVMYLKLHFWTQGKYNEWTNTPAAHANPHYKFAFIEDEEGNMVSDLTLKSIRKTIRGCWAKLMSKSMAPKSWGKANASAKDLVYSLAYKAFPFLQLAENNWKIELLCSLDYPGWVCNNLNNKGNWFTSRKVKQEEESPDIDEAATSASRKCKAKTSKSEVAEKRLKDDSTPERLPASPDVSGSFSAAPSPTALDQFGSSAMSTVTQDIPLLPLPATVPSPLAQEPTPVVSPTSSTITEYPASLSSLSLPIAPPPDVQEPMMSLTPSTEHISSLSLLASVSSSASASESTSVSSPVQVTPSTDLNDKPNLEKIAAPARIPDSEDATLINVPSPIVVDALSNLVRKSITLKLPPLPPMPKPAKKDENMANESNTGGSGHADGGLSRGKRKATTNCRMRPTKNKTGYNLCAMQWLAQINENGTCDQFRTYWNHELNEGQREAYKSEAKELVVLETWNDTITRGKLH